MTASGHEDQFRPPSLSGGCRLGKETFLGMGVKEEDAPIAAIRRTAVESRGCSGLLDGAWPSFSWLDAAIREIEIRLPASPMRPHSLCCAG